MVQWTDPREGYARLGKEFTPEYRGYVINISEIGQEWYAYAWDSASASHTWVAGTETEHRARTVLEIYTGETCSGLLCEEALNAFAGRCPNTATFVRWTTAAPGARHVRVTYCSEHAGSLSGWTLTPISEYLRDRKIIPDDRAKTGGCLGQAQGGERTWSIAVDCPCQGLLIRRALRQGRPRRANAGCLEAARELISHLPNSGPWYLRQTELHIIRWVLERLPAGGRPDPHSARRIMTERIAAASDEAFRQG
ncbi:hypothetical protein ACFV1L_05985 [Kitasatospora sp. NPDC059646]|uniref:hypothetical protein n=1 Tax=Kitasatospora sp. NPDC059646 TaxID=3346893 RepID=UPI0036C266AD